MPADNRDRDIVEHLLRYCEQVETAHMDFGHSRQRFDGSTTYQNAVSMCILQIGELAGHLSDEFKTANTIIPWHKIRGIVKRRDGHQRQQMDSQLPGLLRGERCAR